MEDKSATSSVLLMAKVGAMVGLGFGSLALGMLPLIVARCQKRRGERRQRRGISGNSGNSSGSTTTSGSNASTCSGGDDSAGADSQGLLTSLLLCFGGGVLLFTTFLHLAPEVRISVERHQSNDQLPLLGSLSLAELLFCAGFFLVYLVEEAVHAALTGKPESSDALLYRTVSVRRCNNQTGVASAGSTTTVSTMTVSTSTTRSTWKDERDEIYENDHDFRETYERRKFDRPAGKIARRFEELVQGGKDQREVLPAIFVLSSPVGLSKTIGDSSDVENQNPSFPKVQTPERQQRNENDGQNQRHQHQHFTARGTDSSVQGLLTVLALSFHAIFEGLAVGLEPAIGSVVYLAAAIATHKLVISFCVGMELYVAGASSRTTLGYLSVFSMVTPIGIAVGLALGHFKNDSENLGPTPTILQGMAAGTLLYVVFFEVLARERANDKSGLLQLAAIILGFTLMLSLQILTAHSHSHGGGHGHSHGPDHSHETGQNQEEHDAVTVENHAHTHTHTHAPHETGKDLIGGAIQRVTESIAEAVTTALTVNSTRQRS